MRVTLIIALALLTMSVAAESLRVISLAPSTTEIVFALGRGDWLVGRSDFCKWPAEAQSIASVGGYFNLDREALVALEPDLIVGVNLSDEDRALLDAVGIDALFNRSESVSGVQDAIRAIAARLDCAASGEAVIAQMDAEFASLAEQLRDVAPRKTLMIVGHEPDSLRNLFAVGPDSWMNDLLTMAGAENALGKSVGPFPEISLETVLITDPDVIIDTGLQLDEATPERRARLLRIYEERLGALRAVHESQLILWTDAHLGIPGPSMPAQVRALAQSLHPELDWSTP